MENFSEDYTVFSRKSGIKPFCLFRHDLTILYNENYPEDRLNFSEGMRLAEFIWSNFPQCQDFYRGGAEHLKKFFLQPCGRNKPVCWTHLGDRILLALQHNCLIDQFELGLQFLQSIGLWRASQQLQKQDPVTDKLHTLFPHFVFSAGIPTPKKNYQLPGSLEKRRRCFLLQRLEKMSFERNQKKSGVPQYGLENWDLPNEGKKN